MLEVEVGLFCIAKDTALHVDALHLAPHQLNAIEGRILIGRRLQELCQARDEACADDADGVVFLLG